MFNRKLVEIDEIHVPCVGPLRGDQDNLLISDLFHGDICLHLNAPEETLLSSGIGIVLLFLGECLLHFLLFFLLFSGPLHLFEEREDGARLEGVQDFRDGLWVPFHVFEGTGAVQHEEEVVFVEFGLLEVHHGEFELAYIETRVGPVEGEVLVVVDFGGVWDSNGGRLSGLEADQKSSLVGFEFEMESGGLEFDEEERGQQLFCTLGEVGLEDEEFVF